MIDKLGIEFAEKFENFCEILAEKFTNFCTWATQGERLTFLCVSILILIFELYFFNLFDKKWRNHLDNFWEKKEKKGK